MAEEKVTPPDVVKVITILKLEDGTVIDASELSSEQREAYIEFAIHLAAPKIAKLITQGMSQQLAGFDAAEQSNINEAYYRAYCQTRKVLQIGHLKAINGKISA